MLCVCAVVCAPPASAAEAVHASVLAAPTEAPSFQQQLTDLAAADDVVIGIAVRDLATGDEFSVNGERQFSQTGLSKLHILIALYREAEAGRVDLTSRHTLTNRDKLPGGILSRLSDNSVTMNLRDYAMLMTVMDDNSAANVLLEKIGLRSVNHYLAALITKDIHFAGLVTDPNNPDDNTATPVALVQCLDQLYHDKIVSRQSRDDIFVLLGTPRVSSLRSSLPPSVKVASKAGFRGPLRCSAGIVFIDKHPYAIVIMMRPVAEIQNGPDVRSGEKIAALSLLCYSHFSSLGEKYPVAPGLLETAACPNPPSSR